MTSSAKNLSPVLAELTVEVPKEDVQKAFAQAYAKLGRTAKISGFRKGKVPRSVLRRMFGEAVQGEVRIELVNMHLLKAFEEHKIEPVSQPEMDPKELVEDEPFGFTVKFEVRQKLEKLVFDDIEIERHRTSTSTEEIDAECERLRSAMAALVELEEPRPAIDGDLAKIILKRWVDGDWQEGSWSNQEIVIGEKRIEKEVEEALIGMNIDEEKTVDLGSDKEMEEERVRYLVKLEGLRGRKLPELDDEFAKDMGDFETLDALTKDIESRLQKIKEQAEEKRLSGVLFEKVREKNPMEFPPSLLDRQKQALAMRIESSLAMLGDKGPEEKERDKLFERAEPAAREMIHQQMLVLEVSRLEDIKVEDDEIDKGISEFALEQGLPEPMVRAEYAKEGRREELSHQLLEKKIFDFMLPKVKIKDIDPPLKPKDEEGK